MPKIEATHTPFERLKRSQSWVGEAIRSSDPAQKLDSWNLKISPLGHQSRREIERWLVAEVMALPVGLRGAVQAAFEFRQQRGSAIEGHIADLSGILYFAWHGVGEYLVPEEPGDAPSLTLTQRQIMQVCADIEKMLLAKNRKYGDSALNPKRIFSKASPIEQIHVRIDDKISRIESAQSDEDEDVINDLLGYLVLLKVAMMRQGVKGQETRERRFDELHRRFDRALPSDQPEGEVYVARVMRDGSNLLAEFPDAPGCQTFAKTMPELARLAKEALEGWLEANLADRVVPSRPRFRGGPGMQLRVAIDPELSRKLRDARDQVRRPSDQSEGKRKGR